MLVDPYPLSTVVAHGARLAQFLLGLERGDEALIRDGLQDVLVEPRRAPLVPGFAAGGGWRGAGRGGGGGGGAPGGGGAGAPRGRRARPRYAGRNSSVSAVATISPPMIATAIGPKNAERDSGIIARIAASAVSTIGRKRRTVASMIASQRSLPARDVLLDLVHQDHRVAHDHAGQRDRAQHRDEAERHAEHQQEQRHADQAQRRGQQHQRVREKLCSCSISSVTTTSRNSGMPALIELWPRALSSVPAGLDAVAHAAARRGWRRASARSARVHVGACTLPSMSARTVIVGRRSRRQMMPSSST